MTLSREEVVNLMRTEPEFRKNYRKWHFEADQLVNEAIDLFASSLFELGYGCCRGCSCEVGLPNRPHLMLCIECADVLLAFVGYERASLMLDVMEHTQAFREFLQSLAPTGYTGCHACGILIPFASDCPRCGQPWQLAAERAPA